MKIALVCLLSILIFNLFAQNQKYILKTGKGYDLIASDVLNSEKEIKRQIQIVKGDTLPNTFILTVISSDDNNIVEALKNKTFSGTFTIAYDNVVILKGESKVGVPGKLERISVDENLFVGSNEKPFCLEVHHVI